MEMLRAESAGLTFSVVAPSSLAGIRHSEKVDEVDANNTNFKQCMISDDCRVNRTKRIESCGGCVYFTAQRNGRAKVR